VLTGRTKQAYIGLCLLILMLAGVACNNLPSLGIQSVPRAQVTMVPDESLHSTYSFTILETGEAQSPFFNLLFPLLIFLIPQFRDGFLDVPLIVAWLSLPPSLLLALLLLLMRGG
jgi:hypothetical protein